MIFDKKKSGLSQKPVGLYSAQTPLEYTVCEVMAQWETYSQSLASKIKVFDFV